MALNDLKLSAAYTHTIGLGAYNNSTNTFAYYLVSDSYAAIDVTAATLNISDLTVVATAGAYTSGTTIAGTTWAKSGASSTLDSDNFSIAANASNPTTAKCLVIVNVTGGNDVYSVSDMTTDGTTAPSLVNGANFTVSASGISTNTTNA